MGRHIRQNDWWEEEWRFLRPLTNISFSDRILPSAWSGFASKRVGVSRETDGAGNSSLKRKDTASSPLWGFFFIIMCHGDQRRRDVKPLPLHQPLLITRIIFHCTCSVAFVPLSSQITYIKPSPSDTVSLIEEPHHQLLFSTVSFFVLSLIIDSHSHNRMLIAERIFIFYTLCASFSAALAWRWRSICVCVYLCVRPDQTVWDWVSCLIADVSVKVGGMD